MPLYIEIGGLRGYTQCQEVVLRRQILLLRIGELPLQIVDLRMHFPSTLSNENNLAVTYSSSETSVATIAADGTITLVAAGSTVITATSEETAEFEAGHAQYTLTVKDAQVVAVKSKLSKSL